jgi:hypothetical protein
MTIEQFKKAASLISRLSELRSLKKDAEDKAGMLANLYSGPLSENKASDIRGLVIGMLDLEIAQAEKELDKI